MPTTSKLEPLKIRDSRPKVFCWQRHARFVSEWAALNLGADINVVSVTDPASLRGFEDGVYVQVRDVDTVNDRASDSLTDVAIGQGFTILTIDDYPKRKRFEERHGRR